MTTEELENEIKDFSIIYSDDVDSRVAYILKKLSPPAKKLLWAIKNVMTFSKCGWETVIIPQLSFLKMADPL